jgi:hypothetical protein
MAAARCGNGGTVSDDLTAPISADQLFPRERALSYPPAKPTDWVRTMRLMLLTGLTLYGIAFTARAYARNYFGFLPDYARWMLTGGPPFSRTGPTHVFMLMTDHFEPDYDAGRVDEWARRYMALAARHRDSAGRPVQHTFFYPGEQTTEPILRTLHDMTAAGLGEVEFHYHHQYDTEAIMREQVESAIDEFQQFGFLKTVDGQTQFAFIHGNSGLDNSNGDEMCGVNAELRLLHQLGCFADFTFPSLYEDSQPGTVNSIYAARDDPGPKSYEHRLPLTALRDNAADLMIFEGPLIFSPTLNLRHLFLHLDDGDVHASEHASPGRVDDWVRANVHVPQRPDWVFVKLFAHGASTPADMDAVLGADFDDALTYLEREYNDGSKYVLHYITAREAYNLARAAGEGARGEPQQYLNAYVRPYMAGSKRCSLRAKH